MPEKTKTLFIRCPIDIFKKFEKYRAKQFKEDGSIPPKQEVALELFKKGLEASEKVGC